MHCCSIPVCGANTDVESYLQHNDGLFKHTVPDPGANELIRPEMRGTDNVLLLAISVYCIDTNIRSPLQCIDNMLDFRVSNCFSHLHIRASVCASDNVH